MADNMNLISIITVVYNGEKYLGDTIQSIINQSYENIEYIIIDGGSTDGTIDIIKKYEDKIDYWISEKDNGIYDAMNKGIKQSKGEIIGIVNADDFLFLDTVEKIVKKYNTEKFDYTYSSLDYIDEKGNVLDQIASIGIDNFKYKIFKHMPFLHPTMFIRKKVYDEIGLYDTSFKIAADYDFVLRILKNKYIGYKLDFKTGCFRIGGVSGDNRILKENSKVLLKNGQNYLLVLFNEFILRLKLFLRNKK